MENQNEAFEKNLNYLENQLKFTGMPAELNSDLKKAMEKGNDNFQLEVHKEYGNDKIDAVLNFNKSEMGYYFFNSYNLTLNQESEKTVSKTFRVEYGKTFSLKEAYNMLDGRSVHKTFINKSDPLQEQKSTNAWNYIDFKNTSENGEFLIRQKYNYNLEAELSKLPIKNFHIPQVKLDLMDSLKKGNTQQTTLQIDGTDVKMNLEASPRYGSINIYDENMERTSITYSKAEENTKAQNQEITNEGNNINVAENPSQDSSKKQNPIVQNDQSAPSNIQGQEDPTSKGENQDLSKGESITTEGPTDNINVAKENALNGNTNKKNQKAETKTENKPKRSRRVG